MEGWWRGSFNSSWQWRSVLRWALRPPLDSEISGSNYPHTTARSAGSIRSRQQEWLNASDALLDPSPAHGTHAGEGDFFEMEQHGREFRLCAIIIWL